MTEIGFSSKILMKISAIIEQKYQGDITIVPEIPISWYGSIISNPRAHMVSSFTVIGEKATWPSKNQFNSE